MSLRLYVSKQKMPAQAGLPQTTRARHAASARSARALTERLESRQLMAADGLAGHWAFDAADVSGATVIDRSGNGMHGTLANGATTVAGRVDRAVALDGVNDYVAVGNVLPSGGTRMTAAAWVNKRDKTGDDRIISKASDTSLNANYIWSLGVAEDVVRVRLRTGGVTRSFDGPRISTNEWHHVAFTYDGSRVQFYVDGALARTRAAAGSIPASNIPAVIGNGDAGQQDRYFNGMIDEVRLYDRALSAGEVASLTTASSTPEEPPPPAEQPPVAPTGLTATTLSTTQVRLAWSDNSANEVGFKIERSTNGVDFVQVAAVGGTTTYTAGGLSPSTAYQFRVRAYNVTGDSGYSNTATATTATPTPVQAPFGGTARAVPGVIQAEDFDTGGEGIAYHDTTAANEGEMYRPQEGPDIADGGFSDDGTHSLGWMRPDEWLEYTVNVPSAGNFTLGARVSSVLSTGALRVEVDGTDVTGTLAAPNTGDFANWTTVEKTGVALAAGTHVMRVYVVSGGFNFNYLHLTSEAPPTVPTPPSALTATAASSSQINLAWADNSDNETGFKIERSTDGQNFTQVATVGGATTYAATGLSPSSTYYFRVRAYNTVGDSATSNVAGATTPAAPTLPTAPSGLAAAAVSSSQINLSWADTSSNESGFKVERSTNGSSWTQIATVAANVSTYAATGLSASTAYQFRVRATNAAGDSPFSNTASATTQPTQTGAMPVASNTGYTGTLTTVSGVYTARAGEVIENKLFLSGIIVPNGADNVVIRNCKITGGLYGIRAWDGARNLLIENVEIDGSASPGAIGSKGIVGFNFTVRRCHIHHTGSDGIQVVGGNTLIEHNYIHDVSYGGYVTGSHSTDDHADGIQLTSGGDNHVWRFNNIRMPASQYAQAPWGTVNSCLVMQYTDLTSFTIEGNWLYGGGYTIRLEPNGKTMTGGIVKDNKVGPKPGHPDVLFGPFRNVGAQVVATNNRFSYPGDPTADDSLAFGNP